MDWFERLTGFREGSYLDTKARLRVEGNRLCSSGNGASFNVGQFSLLSLGELRLRLRNAAVPEGALRVSIIQGDVRRLHRRAEFQGSLFQVASQFNMLEMISPEFTPEHGVTRYELDHTQGPACAIAAGAATIFRNYFAPVGAGEGQTAICQIDGLSEVSLILAEALGRSPEELWTMRNGYALPKHAGLAAIAAHLADLPEKGRDALRSQLVLGLHEDVEVTDHPDKAGQIVSQIFCSALPVAYSGIRDDSLWSDFATLVLDAAYEATILAALLNSARGSSSTVLQTSLGGGAFGNREDWILRSMRRAIALASGFSLDILIVSYGMPSAGLRSLCADFAA